MRGVKKKYLTPLFFCYMITQVNYMDEILKRSLLYDFYGELLTQHQKNIYEQFILDDLSLSEIADDAGISRQGVHDLIKRCNKSLADYEDKLHLVERFLSVKEKARCLEDQVNQFDGQDMKTFISEVKRLTSEMIEEL